MSSESPVLSIDRLCAGYGHVPVLRDVTLEVRRGEIVTLLGANGAGKSTLMRAVMGIVKATSGEIRLDGRVSTHEAPERMVRKGVALVPEGRMIFGSMTVEDNLRLGAHVAPRAAFGESLARVLDLFPVLKERLGQTASTLSGGEQQMLAIARGLMSSPRVLLLDEPSLGLAPKVIAEIFSTLDRLRSEGIGVLLVEQDVKVALRHADRGYVMRTGGIVMQGTGAELMANEAVRHAYLGVWDVSKGTASHAGQRDGSAGS